MLGLRGLGAFRRVVGRRDGAGHDYLKGLGYDLIPADAPNHFTDETPTAVLVRQVLGPIP